MTCEEFCAWCKDVGVHIGSCEAAYVGEGAWRGIKATAALEPGDVLMQVRQPIPTTKVCLNTR